MRCCWVESDLAGVIPSQDEAKERETTIDQYACQDRGGQVGEEHGGGGRLKVSW